MILRSEYDPRLFHGIAHRGYHDDISPENSLSAFKKAIEANLPFECDVHLTKDGEILICHDGDLQRMTGIPGKIEELTLAEIRGKYKLPDGSDLPLLKEALQLCQERVPIVVELKVVNANYKPLAEKTLALLEGIQNKKNITIISFDPRALKSCKKKGFSLGLLVEKNNTWVLMFRGFFDYLDIEDCLVNDKRVLSYRKKGRLVNVWTIDTKEKLDYIRGKVDMITFQHLPLKDVEDAHAR